MRKLKLKINDKDYLLEMNRNKPVTYFDLIWNSLFIANHKDVNSNLAMKLMESYEKEHNVADVIKFAVEEYSAFMNALADTNSKKNETLEIIEA